MSFAQPWMLLGALAALIPLLIHLFDRRRPRPVAFGAISFVLKSQRRTASRLKLRRLILYALRTLILLAIPVALARPECGKDAQAAALARGPAATAIILDASLSMRFKDRDSLFEKGRALAREALRDLRPDEPAQVLVCTPSAGPPGAPIFDRARLREILDEAEPTWLGADLNRCLDLAARALEESPMAGKRLVVVSDLTATSLRLEAPPPTLKGPDGQQVRPEVDLRDAAEGRETLPNRAIVDLRIEPALQAGPRTFQFTVTVRNFSNEAAQDLEAALRVGDRVVTKGFLAVPPNGTTQKLLTWKFEDGGLFTGELTLTPDALAEDDRRSFVLPVPRELKALVVNGAPSSVRYRDEAFFVDAALGAQGSPVREAVRDAAAAWREDFSTYDLVFLLNAPAPPEDVAARLRDFVQKGGGLFASMGDRVDPDEWNARLGPLLPRQLRLVKTAAIPGDEGAEARASRLGQIALDHPIFSPFTGRAGEGLQSARFFKYMLLESEGGGADAPSQVLATYDDGAPAFAVGRHGDGRVVLYTSTVDRDWGDLAIRTSFLPLIQRTSSFLTGSLEERESMRPRVGATVNLRPQGSGAIGQVKSPSGEEVPLRRDDGVAVAGPLEEPGVYEVQDGAGKPLADLAFAAALDPAESDLARIDPAALEAWFGEATVTRGEGGDDAPAVPLWTWLIAAAALAFFFEGVLLRK